MHLMYYLDEKGNRVYTLKVCTYPDLLDVTSHHPRFANWCLSTRVYEWMTWTSNMTWLWRDFRCWHQSENFMFNGDAHLDYTQYFPEPIWIYNIWCSNYVSILTHQFFLFLSSLVFILKTSSLLQTWIVDNITRQHPAQQNRNLTQKRKWQKVHTLLVSHQMINSAVNEWQWRKDLVFICRICHQRRSYNCEDIGDDDVACLLFILEWRWQR